MNARLRRTLFAKRRKRVPAGVKEDEERFDAVVGRDGDELREPGLEPAGVLCPQLIVQEHPHGVETGGSGPAQLDMDAQRVERVRLKHLQLVDGGRGDVVGADEPALRSIPLVRALR